MNNNDNITFNNVLMRILFGDEVEFIFYKIR